jgi:tetratricopeptide (TPR) repeat protein
VANFQGKKNNTLTGLSGIFRVILVVISFGVTQVLCQTPILDSEVFYKRLEQAKVASDFETSIELLDRLYHEVKNGKQVYFETTTLKFIAKLYLENRRDQEVIYRFQNFINHLEAHQITDEIPLAIHNLAKAYQLIGKKDSSLLYYEQADALINNDDSLYRHNLKEYGDILSEVGQPELGLKKSLAALELMERANDLSGAAFVHGTIGKTYQKLGKIPEGLAAFQKAYSYYQQEEKYNQLVVICINIGALYGNIGQLSEAEKYFKEAIHYSQYIPLKPFIGNIYSNLYVIAYNKPDLDSAAYYLEQSTKIFKAFSYDNKVLRNNTIYSSLLREAGKYKEAAAILHENYGIARKLNDKQNLVLITNSLGFLYSNLDSLDLSEKYLLESLVLSEDLKELRLIYRANKALFELYLKKKEINKAHEYFQIYENYRDSTFTESHNAALARLQTEFETERKNREIAELNRENTEKAFQLNQQQAALKIASLQKLEQEQAISLLESQGALLALEHENTNILLQQKTLENENYQKDLDLAMAQQALQAAALEKERNQKIAIMLFGLLLILLMAGSTWALIERKRIKNEISESQLENKLLRSQMKPHFVFNALQSINQAILNNENSKASDFLTRFSVIIRAFLHNSLHDEVPLSVELETVKNYLEIEQELLKNKFEFEIIADSALDLENLMIPPLLLQPFLENAIWHGIAPKDGLGKIKLELQQVASSLQITITDDGIGREKAKEVLKRPIGHKESVGVKLTLKRLQLLCKNKIAQPVVFEDLKQGFLVRLFIPVKEAF